jgi:hypothetical protein
VRVWWDISCDDSHRWETYVDEDEGAPRDLPEQLAPCPVCGQPAVMAFRLVPSDRARISLVPAACTTDDERSHVWREDRYYLKLTSHDGTESLLSGDDYEWEEAVKRAGWFRRLSYQQAANRFDRVGLGKQPPLTIAGAGDGGADAPTDGPRQPTLAQDAPARAIDATGRAQARRRTHATFAMCSDFAAVTARRSPTSSTAQSSPQRAACRSRRPSARATRRTP